MDAIHPVVVIRSAYILAAVAVASATLSPIVQQRLIPYGPRAEIDAKTPAHRDVKNKAKEPNKLPPYIEALAQLQVPHSWFAQFYIASVALSLLWAAEILRQGPIFRSIATITKVSPQDAVALDRTLLAWTMMLVQGTRRLYECLHVFRASSAQMWVVHWLAGLAFYIGMSVVVWIEGAPTLLKLSQPIRSSHMIPSDSASVIRVLSSLSLFAIASYIQHSAHAHLASLRKYSLPSHPAFRTVVCPHYTAELCIYLALAIVAAPPQSFFNRTILSALVFVFVNLGITADQTRTWWERKWGRDAVVGRKRIVPWVW